MRDQEIVGLYEAYLQVHQPQEEVEQLDENVQDVVKGALEKGANFMKTNPVGKALSKIVAPANKGRRTPTATSGGYRPEEVETDLFDTILEYLVSEGYADTNESALVIMANMSEEWRQSIVETFWYGRSGFNPPVVQQRRLGPEVGASGGLSVLAKKGGVEGRQQLMPPGQGKDKWHPGKWTPEGRKRYEDQKNKSPNLLGRIVNTVYKDK